MFDTAPMIEIEPANSDFPGSLFPSSLVQAHKKLLEQAIVTKAKVFMEIILTNGSLGQILADRITAIDENGIFYYELEKSKLDSKGMPSGGIKLVAVESIYRLFNLSYVAEEYEGSKLVVPFAGN